jgi:hypothetical protein
LARKGYPPGLCTAVVREALAAESDDSFSVGVGFGDPDFDDAELDADDVEHAQVR